MRSLRSLAVVMLLAAGCAKTPAPAPPVQPVEGGNLYGQPAGQNPAGGQSSPPAVFQEQTSVQWAEKLYGPDPSDRERASRALGELAEHGFPHLLSGMQSDSWEVRRSSLQAVYKPVMIAHANQTWPVLVGMLNDRQAAIRQDAVIRLTWFDASQSKTCVPLLQSLAKNDSDPDVRRTAAEAILSINYAVSLKKPK